MALTKDQFDDDKDSNWEEPTETEKELTSWVTQHIVRWRDHRDANYMDLWQEYERVFRGIWAAEDKGRESERSRIISPATQQAIETRHAEIMEAIKADYLTMVTPGNTIQEEMYQDFCDGQQH